MTLVRCSTGCASSGDYVLGSAPGSLSGPVLGSAEATVGWSLGIVVGLREQDTVLWGLDDCVLHLVRIWLGVPVGSARSRGSV